MSQSILPPNTLVLLSDTSGFIAQKDMWGGDHGLIIHSEKTVTGRWYTIECPNGYRNSYQARDLIVASFETNYQASVLLEKEETL